MPMIVRLTGALRGRVRFPDLARGWLVAAALAALLALPGTALAQAAPSAFDQFNTQFATASAKWLGTLSTYALNLFAILATIEFAWAGIGWAFAGDDITALFAAFTRKVFAIGAFYTLLLWGITPIIGAHTWPQLIISSFITAGESVAGNTSGALIGDPSQGVGGPAADPGAIFNLGVGLASQVLNMVTVTGLFTSPLPSILAGITSVIVVACFAIITAFMLIAMIEAYIVISAGVLLLGFGGSRMTADFVAKYFSYAMAVGIKLLVLYLIIATGEQVVLGWSAILNNDQNANALGNAVKDMFSILGGSIIYASICVFVPWAASHLLRGAPNIAAGTFLETARTFAASYTNLGSTGSGSPLAIAAAPVYGGPLYGGGGALTVGAGESAGATVASLGAISSYAALAPAPLALPPPTRGIGGTARGGALLSSVGGFGAAGFTAVEGAAGAVPLSTGPMMSPVPPMIEAEPIVPPNWSVGGLGSSGESVGSMSPGAGAGPALSSGQQAQMGAFSTMAAIGAEQNTALAGARSALAAQGLSPMPALGGNRVVDVEFETIQAVNQVPPPPLASFTSSPLSQSPGAPGASRPPEINRVFTGPNIRFDRID
jgi:type IV secretion system protein TrbL